MKPRACRLFLVALAVAASPASAAVETLVAAVAASAPGRVAVDIRFLNTGDAAVRFDPPARLAAQLMLGTRQVTVMLERVDAAAPISVTSQGFVARRYTATLPVESAAAATATLSLPNGAGFAFALPASGTAVAAASPPATAAPVVVVEQSLSSPRADTGNAFLGNLSAYDPIYAVYGPGTNTDAKIQISFKFQLFGQGGDTDGGWLDGLHLAYTQRMYWDLGRKSSPFRNVDYMPEVTYILAARPVATGLDIGGQVGVRHESNGREGTASRSLNTVYIQPVATMPIGGYRLSVGPRLWAFVGDLGDNPDVKRYRGNTGLFAEIGDDDGLRVTTNSRLNLGSKKGSIDLSASYPLNHWGPKINLYAFAQAFTGYGENLFDYNRQQTRFRLGLGFVR